MLTVAGVALRLIAYAGNKHKSHGLGAELGAGYKERSLGWGCHGRMNAAI